MAHCIKHEQCPHCAKLGRDRNGDNLAVYSDGSTYCFSCGFTNKGSRVQAFIQREQRITQDVILPADAEPTIPREVITWLRQYSLTDNDIKSNNLLWSPYWERLIFPYFVNDQLVAWQGRSFNPDKAKWFSKGNLKDLLYIVGNHRTKHIVLTEDIISAIRVSKQHTVCASPIFGSHISTHRILRLGKFYDRIDVWLDKDKEKEAVNYRNGINIMGIDSKVIITDKDPKEYSDSEIEQWLYN